MTTPMGSSAGATTVRASEVGEDQKRGAVHQGQRDDHPVAPAGEQPDGVGHDDPDEGDQAADTDGGCRGQGRGENDQTAHPHHVDAEARSLFVAQAEHIEQATHEDKDGRGRQTRKGMRVQTSLQPTVTNRPRIQEYTSRRVS